MTRRKKLIIIVVICVLMLVAIGITLAILLRDSERDAETGGRKPAVLQRPTTETTEDNDTTESDVQSGVEAETPNATENNTNISKNVPDYSNSEKRMNLYAYRGSSDGVFTNEKGDMIGYQDYRTIEEFKRYKDCGFDVMFIPGADPYNGENYEYSSTKNNLDMCQEVGLKVIFQDKRIADLTRGTESLVGQGKQFATMDALVQKLREYMAPYVNHPAFYGLALKDEPTYEYFEPISQVQRALRIIKPDIFINEALLPYIPEWITTGQCNGTDSKANATLSDYETYLSAYLEKTGTNRLTYDHYPFRTDKFFENYFVNLQKATEVTAKYNADLELIVQSFATDAWRKPEKSDLYFQNNAALAFGVKNIAYFTYWRGSKTTLDTFQCGILNYDGSKMLYDEVQEVNAYTQKMASVILNFDYEKAQVAYSGSIPKYFANLKSEMLQDIASVNATQPTIVTQMLDKGQNRRGYMVMNAQADTEAVQSDTVTLTFTSAYSKVTYYNDGVRKTTTLNDKQVTFELGRGKAVFVIPHN